jgi:hypothetical protein
MGIQEARSGKCYAGIFAFSHGYYREYLQTTLSTPLESNKEYILSMYIILSDYSSPDTYVNQLKFDTKLNYIG